MTATHPRPPRAGFLDDAAFVGIMTLIGGILLVASQCGCAPAAGWVRVVEAGGRVVAVSEPALLGAYAMEQEACLSLPTGEDALCVEEVRERWAPVIEALGAYHDAVCAVMPEAATCGAAP